MNIHQRGTLVTVISVFLLICDNVFSHVFNLPMIKFFAAYVFIFTLTGNVIKFKSISIEWIWISFYIATLALTSFYNLTYQPLLFGLIAITSYKYIDWLPIINKYKVVDALSTILLITLYLGCLATLTKLLGLSGIHEYKNLTFYPFGYLYGAEIREYPRLTGFFLEPGQLSFYICAVVTCRHYLQMPPQKTVILLLLGLLTQSLAHVFFMIGYFIFTTNHNALNSAPERKIPGLLFNLIFLVIGLIIVYENGWMQERFINVLQLNPETWQRLNSYTYALNLFDGSLKDILLGPSAELSARIISEAHSFSFNTPNASLYGENPLSPIIFGGLLASWPFYVAIIYPLISTLRNSSHSLLLSVFMLLTLQRPYTLEFPYTFIIALVFSCYFFSKRASNSRNIYQDSN